MFSSGSPATRAPPPALNSRVKIASVNVRPRARRHFVNTAWQQRGAETPIAGLLSTSPEARASGSFRVRHSGAATIWQLVRHATARSREPIDWSPSSSRCNRAGTDRGPTRGSAGAIVGRELAGENAIHYSECPRNLADCSDTPATLGEGTRAGGEAARQRRRAAGAGEQGVPPGSLGHRSANGSDFVDESLARIKRSFQLSQAGICNHRFGVVTHHDADRQRARNCVASKTNSMRTKMCIRFSRLAEHMSAIVVPIAQTMKIDRQYRIILKEIGLAASHEDRNIRNRADPCPECDRRHSSEPCCAFLAKYALPAAGVPLQEIAAS